MLLNTPNQTTGEMYALAIILPLLASVFVALRFTARYMKRTRLGWDDWTVVFSLVFTFLSAIFMIVATARGSLAQHMTITSEGPVLDDRFFWFLKMLWAIQLSQTLAIGPCKIAVLLLYRRIFRGKIFNITTWAMIGFMVAWTVAFFFANMLECVPVDESWKDAPGLGGNPHCIDAIPMYMAQVYTDVIMDVLILALPIPLVLKLQLPIKQKVAVIGMFLLGFITTLSSCAKMIVYYLVAAEMAQVPDLSYFMSPVIYWPLIESTLQIIAACLPLLRPLIPGKDTFLTADSSKKGWYGQSTYSGLSGDHTELGNTTVSMRYPLYNPEHDTQPVRAQAYPSEIGQPDGQEIYVQRFFAAQVEPTRK